MFNFKANIKEIASDAGIQINGDQPWNIQVHDAQEAKLAKGLRADLPEQILLQDYRKPEDEGLFLLHTIGHRYHTYTADPWVNKYIFPNGKTPYINHISQSISGLLILEDWLNFGMDYGKTLQARHSNFETNWSAFEQQYGGNFYRMWRYYLLSFAGAFNARHMQLWQMIFTKPGKSKMYRSIR